MRKILIFSLFLLALPFIIRPGFAQCATPAPFTTPRAEGLISGQSISGLDNKNGNCIYGVGDISKVNLDNAKILKDYSTRDYAGFKTTFYDRSKFSVATHRKPFTGSIPLDNGDFLYWWANNPDKNLNVSSSPSGFGTKVIFVDGNLNIQSDINYPSPGLAGGLVFVVGGDINIYPVVKNVDAVLISFGNICTAGDDTSSCTSNGPVLTINGSLISLNKDPDPANKHIKLVRSLSPNDRPAEIINAQPKYLKLLTVNDLMDEDLIINQTQ